MEFAVERRSKGPHHADSPIGKFAQFFSFSLTNETKHLKLTNFLLIFSDGSVANIPVFQ